jgi:hypothetical protein
MKRGGTNSIALLGQNCECAADRQTTENDFHFHLAALLPRS